MAVLTFALAQLDFTVGAVRGNAERMRAAMAEATTAGADLLAFPELALCGYPAEDLIQLDDVDAACMEAVHELAENARELVACVGHPLRDEAELFNACSVLRDGAAETRVRKQNLRADEYRYFAAGAASTLIAVNGVHIGLLIGSDLDAEAPAAHAVAAGAELLLVMDSSPYDTAQAARREQLLAQRACDNQVAIIWLNAVGGQGSLVFDGASLLVEADGSVVARGPAFVDQLLLARFDSVSGRFDAVWPHATETQEDGVIYAGLVRALRDYVHKNGFHHVLLGLSGGIDSSLTLAIAVDALGPDQVTAVLLPSRFTSDLSTREAERQARRLGVKHELISIEPAVEAMRASLAPLFAGLAEDLTEENLQARCRGVLLMALSNKFGGLLLTCGNKSEEAVGYSTLYGDTCGGFAPIVDVYKTRVWSLARWRNEQGEEVIPQVVIDRPPSAELREGQADADTLPPYDVLDAILQRLLEGAQTPEAIIAEGFDAACVRRVMRLLLMGEYKRRQVAPGPKITPCALGQERRYPLSSAWR